MPLSPLLQTDKIKRSLKAAIDRAEPEVRNHRTYSESVDENALRKLRAIDHLLRHPADYPLAHGQHYTNHIIVDVLHQNGVIETETRYDILAQLRGQRRRIDISPST